MARRSKFVRPETRVLTLPDGDTLTVKRRLNHGERQETFARMYLTTDKGDRRVDPLKVGMATVLAFLIDWTLVDDAGNVMAIRGKTLDEIEATLNALDPDDFQDIRRAIEEHEQAMVAERVAGKATDGEQTSSATSPSPDAAAGATSGSGT